METLSSSVPHWRQLSVLSALVIVFTAYLLYNIASGYDLGDHGFYLLHLRQPGSITYTLTHFGLVWNFLIGDHGIVLNRSLNVFLVISSAVSPIVVYEIFVFRECSAKRFVLGVTVAIAAGLSYFASFIVDPSYNSAAFILIFFGIALAGLAAEFSERGYQKIVFFLAAVLGALVAALLMSKASSALAFSLYLLIVAMSIAMQARSVPLFALLLMFTALGATTFFIAFQAATGMLPHTLASFTNGLQTYTAGGSHSTGLLGTGALERVYRFFWVGVACVFHGGWLLVLPVACTVLFYSVFSDKFVERMKLRTNAMAVLLVFFLALSLVILNVDEGVVRNQLLTVFNLCALFSLISWRWIPLGHSGGVLFAGVLFAPLFIIFGTTNDYSAQILFIGGGLSLLPAWIAVSTFKTTFAPAAKSILLAVASFTVIMSIYSSGQYPYLLVGNLSSAQVEVKLPDGDVLNVAPPLASFINELQNHAYITDGGSPRPVVFDLTGQLPLAVHLLNGDTAGAAWIVDFFNSDFSKIIYSSLDVNAFSDGWILARVDENGDLYKGAPQVQNFLKRLEDLGIVFSESFSSVASFSVPKGGRSGSKFEVVLYKPTGMGIYTN